MLNLRIVFVSSVHKFPWAWTSYCDSTHKEEECRPRAPRKKGASGDGYPVKAHSSPASQT